MKLSFAILLLALAAPAGAQPAPADVRVERVAPGVAVLFGRGGMSPQYGRRQRDVDDKCAVTERILAAVRRSPDP